MYNYLFKYDVDRSIMHHKFDTTGIQTHNPQIMDSTFHVPDIHTYTI